MKNNLKTKVSALLAVLMMLTCIPWTTPVAVSAAETIHRYDMMNTDWITDGAEYVTVNTDGTWTITGPIAISPNLTLDYTVYSRLIQQFEVIDGTVKMVLWDHDPNGVYEDHWISLSEFNIGTCYLGGYTSFNQSIESIFDWYIKHNGWTNQNNLFTVNELIIEPSEDATVVLKTLKFVDHTIPDVPVRVMTTRRNTTVTSNYEGPIITTFTGSFATTTAPIYTTINTTATRPSDYTPNWTETVSLMPATASEFVAHEGGGGQITVTSQGSSYHFDATQGWPYAEYNMGQDGIVCNENDDLYLNYDFEVTYGRAAIYVLYGGLSAFETGLFENLGNIVTPHSLDSNGYPWDIPVGKYSGSVKISKLCYYEYLKDNDGDMLFSGCRIFAVDDNGSVIVNELSIGEKKYTEVTDLSPEWTETVSLMPVTASEFVESEGEGTGGGIIEVTHEGEGYRFASTGGWPFAYHTDNENGICVNKNDDLYLNYDIEVISGETNVIVYFGGQNPNESAAEGTFVSINGLVDPSNVDKNGNALRDLGQGRYVGSVSIRDLGYSEGLIGENGEMLFSGCRIFALSGATVVRELSIGKKKGEEEEKPIGDMSGDGELNTMDALLLFAVINGAKTATAEQQALADFNGDGTLNMMDALLLFKFVSGQ